MIRELDIENFQSHKRTALRLAPTLTALVGTSDSGKSAILRAFAWLATNRPRGNAFIRHGADSCSVAVRDGEGNEYSHRKRKASVYTWNSREYNAVGPDVPPQVRDGLGVGEINIQAQFEGHFLIGDAPGRIASAINSATRLEDADAARSRLESRRREAERGRAAAAEELAGAKRGLKRYARLPEYEALCRSAKEAGRMAAEARGRADGLGSSLADLSAAKGRLARLPDPSRLEAILAAIRAKRGALAEAERRADGLRGTLAGLAGVRGLLEAPESEAELERTIAEARDAADRLGAARARRGGLRTAIAAWRAAYDDWREMEGGMAEAQRRYNEALAELDTCPMCGQGLDEAAKRNVLEAAG